MLQTSPFERESSWMGLLSWVAALMGVSTGISATSMSPSLLIYEGLRILLLGSIIETGRKIFQWAADRFKFRYTVSGKFEERDVSYDWLVNYLVAENVWHTPRDILVKSKTSQEKWKYQTSAENSQVDYVPFFGAVQFFRWKGYWLEVSGLRDGVPVRDFALSRPSFFRHATSISLSVYTRDISVLFAFVEECRLKYLENNKSNVTIYSADSTNYSDMGLIWQDARTKRRRPLDSLLLDEGMIGSILADAREFIAVEDWYIKAGIPHRRGYLLYGPPGTGKTSTVYTLAGELGLDIYVLSLSANGMNDNGVARLLSELPPKGILLIEDIDCAFPSREELDEKRQSYYTSSPQHEKSEVTMSGLLNMLDGIGSGEGKLFFATTNHIDRLDPALIRPGRIDRKIEYKLASRKQAHALFMRFVLAFKAGAPLGYPEAKEESQKSMGEAADEFARAIPENEFSMAELQGYLLEWKRDLTGALCGIGAWVESERRVRQARAARAQLRKDKQPEGKPQESCTSQEPVIVPTGNAIKPGLSADSEAASHTSVQVPRTQTSGGGDSDANQLDGAVTGAKDSRQGSSILDVEVP